MRKRQPKDYDHESLRDEREYGFFWYSGLWNVVRPILVVLTALLLVFGVGSIVYGKIDAEYLAPVDTENTTEMPFSIKSGQSLTRVASNLESAGLIRNHSVFKYYCDFKGLGQKIQAGDYTLSPNMTLYQIADKLTTGDGKARTVNITVIPGWTVEGVASMLKEKGVLSDTADFLRICKSGEGVSDYYFIQDELQTQSVSQRKYLLEGYLSPNTYEVYTDATAADIIKKLLGQTDRLWTVEAQERAETLGMTLDQVLTLASLIEKEAKTQDFARVSAVFHNRLKQGIKLGSDVTIHYITGEQRMSLRGSDLQIDSPYNTYLRAGLPLGPICSPSENAVRAALYPDETFIAEKYLYFCSKDPDTGELYFSKTQQEHDAAVAIYAPLWKQYDEERGIR